MKKYLAVPLDSAHKRGEFNCGIELLNNYIKKQASQDVKRKLSTCFVLTDEDNVVFGYYTLSNAGISKKNIPEKLQKRLPESYSQLPVTLLGRLAVDSRKKGMGFGEFLLLDALKRSNYVSKIVGSIAVVVDPIDKQAIQFYLKYGFILLPDSGKMFLSLKTILRLFSKK